MEGLSGVDGVNVAVNPSADTAMVPGTGIDVANGATKKSAVLTVSASTRLLNCNWITALVGTPVAPFAGLTTVTVGGVRSAPVPVVKLVVTGAVSAFPPRSCTPLTLTVYVVLVFSGTTGINVSVWLAFDSRLSTFTAPPPPLSVIWFNVKSSTGSLNSTTTCALIGTPVSPFTGLTPTTLGPVASTVVPVVKK